ncbi:MAG: glycosyltransferase family 4 protein [Phocaeicola sp.]|uniref:glycosyltransferase family 4 protein n=1 Tax=Phocaeicola sp. TaxID=2773926 RepID=UPI003FA01CD0
MIKKTNLIPPINNLKTIAVYLYDSRNPYVGLGEFDHHLAEELSSRAKQLQNEHHIRLCFLLPPHKVDIYGNDVDYLSLTKIKIYLLNLLPKWAVYRWLMPKVALLHLTQQRAKITRSLGENTLLTIHDVNFFHNNISVAKIKKKQRKAQQMLNIAHFVSFISQFTRDDVHQHFHVAQTERVIHNGATNQNTLESHAPKGLPTKDFDLVLSSWDRKKNVDNIVEMMRFLPERHLIVAGRGKKQDRKRLENIIRTYHLNNVTLLGTVGVAEKAYLYQHCKAFYFASRSEGFGLPVIEAMSCGKPVFLSRLTSLPEVGGNKAYYFNSLEPQAMAQTVINGIVHWQQSPNENIQLTMKHAAQFSWKNMADKYIEYYLSILTDSDKT